MIDQHCLKNWEIDYDDRKIDYDNRRTAYDTRKTVYDDRKVVYFSFRLFLIRLVQLALCLLFATSSRGLLLFPFITMHLVLFVEMIAIVVGLSPIIIMMIWNLLSVYKR